jgi:hypothetical protein
MAKAQEHRNEDVQRNNPHDIQDGASAGTFITKGQA